ncbi:MAG: L-seryl-tRNA(Sec) selenium transferase [Thermoleophilia bacterium]|nr:L-seryl-tRNA(Sec) selenium transferase [Thermoleophilia bacterium]
MIDEVRQQALRGLPSVEELVSHVEAAPLLERYPRIQVVEAVRTALQCARRAIMEGGGAPDGAAPGPGSPAGKAAAGASIEGLLAEVAVLLEEWSRPGLVRVANLSGIVVHTNLGRSALAESAVERVTAAARSYCNLEYDLETGSRGSRETHVEALLTRLTGAEAAFAVNNNAGAVLLLLMGLAAGREVLVSRGQLVEIGGSFRLPDIMRAGGVRLVEVGTTNRTRVDDYENAITGDTALLLRVHTSNYRILGFTEEVELSDLVELGHRRDLLVADDLGSGALNELDAYRGEPTVATALRTGVDVVCFSGDKLLGGPQAGILVGSAEAIDRLRKHPVARALRLDKMTLAALEATLELYQDPERVRKEVPTLRYLTRTPAQTAALAAVLQAAVERRCGDGFILEVEESVARAGGGSMPLMELPSHAVRIRFPEAPLPDEATGVVELDVALRHAPLPVVGRVAQDSLHLDVIALDEGEAEAVAESVAWAIERLVAGMPSERPVGSSAAGAPTAQTAPGGPPSSDR